MSHSFVKCWIHAVWSTKYRAPLIRETMEQVLYAELGFELSNAGCIPVIINGMPDHIHSLFELNAQKSISDTMQLVKGLSSHWVNQRPLIADKFAWQTGFAAFSVSKSQLDKTINYIKNQKEHHKLKSLDEGLKELLKLHGFPNSNPRF